MIIYRRPGERVKNAERIQLDDRGLQRIPLLEGEEKLKYLNLSNNVITKIENIVSLPNLSFLDLTGNRIKEIAAHPTVKSLKVLILAKNQIEEIKNLECLPCLEVVDIHDNRIRHLNFKCLQNARVINLSSNMIESLEVNASMPHLLELNLRRNQIVEVKDLADMPALKKLYLSNNNISSLDQVSCLPELVDLTLETNPVDKPGLTATFKDKFPALVYYNLRRISQAEPESKVKTPFAELSLNTELPKETSKELVAKRDIRIRPPSPKLKPREPPVKIELPVFKPKNECNVIKIIQKEWEKEVERLDTRKAMKMKQQLNSNESKCNCANGPESLVQSGHAEIEANRVLYIYGNALEVLQRAEFYDSVEEIHLIYVRFDLIVYHENLDKLKKFTKLRKLVLSNNYLNSYILLSKIECLSTVQTLMMYDNEVM
jgi:Leucine-rich repeat (LRR) protein